MEIKERITQYLSTLNKTQKIIIGFIVSLSIIIFFSHNPFSGYMTEKQWNGFLYRDIIPNAAWRPEPDNWDKALPFSLWRTNSPLIDWLGNVRNFIYSLITLWLSGAIFIGFVFSNSSKDKELD